MALSLVALYNSMQAHKNTNAHMLGTLGTPACAIQGPWISIIIHAAIAKQVGDGILRALEAATQILGSGCMARGSLKSVSGFAIILQVLEHSYGSMSVRTCSMSKLPRREQACLCHCDPCCSV